MTNYNWNYPTTMWVGENRAKDLHLACNNLNIKNPLFVTDKDLIGLPVSYTHLTLPTILIV